MIIYNLILANRQFLPPKYSQPIQVCLQNKLQFTYSNQYVKQFLPFTLTGRHQKEAHPLTKHSFPLLLHTHFPK